jgi:peroxiredoxin
MKSLERTFLGLMIVLGATASACGGSAGGTGPESAGGAKSTLIGNPAPEFALDPLANSKSKLGTSALSGKVVLLDFWATWCGPCKKSFPKIEELRVKYQGSDFRVVAVSEDDDESGTDKAITDFAEGLGVKFAVAWDKDKSVAKKYDPSTMPSSFLIDKKGVVRYAHIGYHDGEENEIDKEIKELLAE